MISILNLWSLISTTCRTCYPSWRLVQQNIFPWFLINDQERVLMCLLKKSKVPWIFCILSFVFLLHGVVWKSSWPYLLAFVMLSVVLSTHFCSWFHWQLGIGPIIGLCMHSLFLDSLVLHQLFHQESCIISWTSVCKGIRGNPSSWIFDICFWSAWLYLAITYYELWHLWGGWLVVLNYHNKNVLVSIFINFVVTFKVFYFIPPNISFPSGNEWGWTLWRKRMIRVRQTWS